MTAALYRQHLLPLPQAFISSYKFSAFLNGRGHWFYVTWLVKCWLDHYSDVISGNGLCDRRPNTNQKELTTIAKRDLDCCTASPMSLQVLPEHCVCVVIYLMNQLLNSVMLRSSPLRILKIFKQKFVNDDVQLSCDNKSFVKSSQMTWLFLLYGWNKPYDLNIQLINLTIEN